MSHFALKLVNPAFDSPLVDVLTELEHLRRLQLHGDTPPVVFFQIKHIFHMLESLGSARIEGNHTTLADYVEAAVNGGPHNNEQLCEIWNIESAMKYVEAAIQPQMPITEQFIRELHSLTVRNLEREGDHTPGAYRCTQVRIAQSQHLPPDAMQVASYMQELVDFVNRTDAPKYDLIKVAQAHHRFSWIHPFNNGNGRVVRLLTYAMLIKYGYNVKDGGRVLNPTAVFCNDREKYCDMLAHADQGSELAPALLLSRQRQLITSEELQILNEVVRRGTTRSADLAKVVPHLSSAQRAYQLRKLVERKMLQPVREGGRLYSISFTNNYLLRCVIQMLSRQGFISEALTGPAP
ncbi:Fic family protein [Duganella sp. FT80W]|uniref:Fic family protein n=1 Tax=Duganella guangzhouensis TaxID=2666084 RepID=A0A6I2LDX4_9BURK|nr:Fic family protein [Duganella guangzhouensis]MRW94449.1 Fic family protein [Duganella guangzhouensis]